MKSVRNRDHTYTICLEVSINTSVWWSLNAVVTKQQNVKPAITLKVKANILFARDRKEFIFRVMSLMTVVRCEIFYLQSGISGLEILSTHYKMTNIWFNYKFYVFLSCFYVYLIDFMTCPCISVIYVYRLFSYGDHGRPQELFQRGAEFLEKFTTCMCAFW